MNQQCQGCRHWQQWPTNRSYGDCLEPNSGANSASCDYGCSLWRSQSTLVANELWEILVPCNWNDGEPVRRRHHQEWDKRVRTITGGLTILRPGKGQWVNADEDEKLYHDRIIPVRLIATAEQMRQIANITIQHYEQLAAMYYKVADYCVVQEATEDQVGAFARERMREEARVELTDRLQRAAKSEVGEEFGDWEDF